MAKTPCKGIMEGLYWIKYSRRTRLYIRNFDHGSFSNFLTSGVDVNPGGIFCEDARLQPHMVEASELMQVVQDRKRRGEAGLGSTASSCVGRLTAKMLVLSDPP